VHDGAFHKADAKILFGIEEKAPLEDVEEKAGRRVIECAHIDRTLNFCGKNPAEKGTPGRPSSPLGERTEVRGE